MEKWQKDHIQSNIFQLIDNTYASFGVMFLSAFQEKGLLTPVDVTQIETISPNPYDKCKKFYEVIQNRKDSFEPLKEILKENILTGALEILNKAVKPEIQDSKAKANQPSKMDYQREIAEGDKKDIARLMLKDQTFCANWVPLADQFTIPKYQSKKFQQDILLDKLTLYDVFYDLLSHWHSRKASDATLVNLVKELYVCEASLVAQSIKTKYGIPDSEFTEFVKGSALP